MVLSCVLLVALSATHSLFEHAGGLRTLYLLPVWVAIRFGGKKAGMCMVLIAAITMGLEDYFKLRAVSLGPILTDSFFRLVSFAGIAWIISGVEARLEQIQALALHDPLTGVFNRRALDEFWTSVHFGGKKTAEQYVVVMIDCDGFKRVNDQYGHQAGDQVLQILGHVLETETRHTDLVARVGGDEFVLVLKETAPSEARRILQRIEQLFETRVAHAGYLCTISVGYAPVESADETIEALLKKADRAMYERKEFRKATAFLN